MAKTRPPYPPEFRRQMVELVRAGRSPEELAQEFEPTAQSIRNWVGQAECDAGRRASGLTTAEREELTQLRRENRQLRLERDSDPNARGGLVACGDSEKECLSAGVDQFGCGQSGGNGGDARMQLGMAM